MDTLQLGQRQLGPILNDVGKVRREEGVCGVCELPKKLVIHAFDPAVYEGGICPDCLIERAEDHVNFPIDSVVVQPMLFVALAARGEEPYRTLLEASDSQTPGKFEKTFHELMLLERRRKELQQKQENFSLLRRQGFASIQSKPNRKQRRIAEANARREARRALRASKRARATRSTSKSSSL